MAETKIKIVANPEALPLVNEFVEASGLYVFDDEKAEQSGYLAPALVPQFPRELTEDELEDIMISPDEVDPDNPEIAPVFIVQVPLVLAELAIRASTDSLPKDPSLKTELMQGIEAWPMGYRADEVGSHSVTVNENDKRVGMHIDSAHLPNAQTYLIVNKGESREHIVSDYMTRREGELLPYDDRVAYLRENPPTANDRALWVHMPGPDTTSREVPLAWGVISPVGRVSHDATRVRTLPGRYQHPDTAKVAFYSINAARALELPSPLYPRESDQAILQSWERDSKDRDSLYAKLANAAYRKAVALGNVEQ